MGACMGRCLSRTENRYLSQQNSQQDFTFLVEESAYGYEENKRNFFIRLFSKRRARKKKPVLEFVDDILNPHFTSYNRLQENQQLSTTSSYNSRDIPLQCLDAKALLIRTTMSTPASSLDLEWEHETLPVSLVHDPSGGSWTALQGQTAEHADTESSMRNNQPNTDSDWSRVSSANSLEWDNVPTSFQGSPPVSEIDTDTQLLLSEIERLTSQTLKETGKEIFS
ncbi:hypothetical protein AMK59_8695 [Oryctes borbonicus]|uniref:Uncharacterized protein n=1 Tax=Oryctes borbonicus TaxID=1629725 RepID=A0A0T6AYQ8_9SCAR|nr:hypothetical protein AMK59_8695 [Oryctes borbonicus]